MSKLLSIANRIILTLLLFPAVSFAAEEDAIGSGYYNTVALLLLFLILIIAIAFLYYGTEEGKPEKEKASGVFAKIRHMLTLSTPIEKENEIILEGHDYDGIRELDNRVPPWFSGLFYVTIIFSIYYMLHFHVFNTGKLMYDEYEDEIIQAEILKAELVKSGALIDENSVELLKDDSALKTGKAIYDANCVACHGTNGEGLVGPNLTDEYYLHGAGIKNVFKIVRDGVPAKGMISWKTLLNPRQIQEVSSYVISLEGTNPPNPKAPEGELMQVNE